MVDSDWLPGDKTTIVATEDFYIFGILSSKVHSVWVEAQKSTLKSDPAYTHETCFEPFPFPQTVNPNLVNQIRQKAEELHQYRTKQMDIKNCGITTLYNELFDEPTSQLHKIHKELDKLVIKAYNFDANKDILEQTFNFNLELAQKEKNKETIVGAYALNQ